MITVGHVIANSFRRRRHCWRLICFVGAAAAVGVVFSVLFLPQIYQFVIDRFVKLPPVHPEIQQLKSLTFERIFPRRSSSNTSKEPIETKNIKNTSQVLKGSRCEVDAIPERPPEDLKESFEWQRVTPGLNGTFVFSAHYDTRTAKPTVLIVGISSEYMAPSSAYFCHLWFTSSAKAEVCTAERYTHTETHVRRYAPVFFTCHFEGDEGLPYAVSLVTSEKRCQSTSNVLKVFSSVHQSKAAKVNFTVCVTPFNYDFDNVNHFVETVELNRMFGAQRFFFYNFSTGSHLEPYVRMYQEEGVIDVIPWKLPVITDDRKVKVEPEIHYFGQLASLNECLMRNRFQSNYVAFTDLDEVVVPRRHKTWTEMVDELTKNRISSGLQAVASLHFRNVFFRTDYERDAVYENNATVVALQLRSLLTTVREEKTFPHGWRSKHIVSPEAVHFVGIHHIEKIFDYSKASVVDVDEATAFLHHYRSWAGEEASRTSTSTDRFMHRFSDQILTRVLAVHSKVANRYAAIKNAVTLDRQ